MIEEKKKDIVDEKQKGVEAKKDRAWRVLNKVENPIVLIRICKVENE